ncbi:hypothetical protein S83_062057, partial [Arachis hypogaea]
NHLAHTTNTVPQKKSRLIPIPQYFRGKRKHKTMLDTMCLKHYLISGILKQLMNT